MDLVKNGEEEGGDDDDEDSLVDNSNTVINKIANLYAERLMSDVILVVGNTEYPSHRLILCASSDVFQVMLMNPNWTESSETKIQLKETSSCEKVFEDFLKYFYTGKILLDYSSVIPIVSLADKYNVKDLLKLGLDYMTRNISTACKKNQIVTWFSFSAASGHFKVSELCFNFIKWNFSRVCDTIDFIHLESDLLIEFLVCNDLVVRDEKELFCYVFNKWLGGQRETMIAKGEHYIDMHIDNLITILIPYIRFPMMTPSQLADLLLNPISTSHTDILVDRMRFAMSFHKNKLNSQSIKLQDTKMFTPRLYTAERFCANISVDKLLEKSCYYSIGLNFTSQKYMAQHLQTTYSGDTYEWSVDLLPKGVWFQRCLTVYQPSQMEVPERILKTVRLSIRTKSIQEIRVRLGILIFGYQDGFEHIRSVKTRNYIFSKEDQIVNFDNLVDFDELHNAKHISNFLSGPDHQTFKINIVITPLTKNSSLD